MRKKCKMIPFQLSLIVTKYVYDFFLHFTLGWLLLDGIRQSNMYANSAITFSTIVLFF